MEEPKFEQDSKFVKSLKERHGKKTWRTGWGWYFLCFLIPIFGIVGFLFSLKKGREPAYKILFISLGASALHLVLNYFGVYDSLPGIFSVLLKLFV